MPKAQNAVDVNLFAGAGGLAIGLKQAGFRPEFLYEKDPVAQATLKANKLTGSTPPHWEVHKGDVTRVDWTGFSSPVRLLAGGVPCQPFSLAGNHLAQMDGRNQFPALIRAVHALTPQAVLIENVYGLLRSDFARYFEYVLRALRSPSVAPKEQESWQEHDRRLKAKEQSRSYSPEYIVESALLNAADYGIPQIRRRVFIVGVRAPLPVFAFPTPTHSRAALIRDQLTGAYWKRHELRRPASLRTLLPKAPLDDGLLPWATVRDALSSLPHPAKSEEATHLNGCLPNHWRIPGARSYHGHRGSLQDWPSKTLKAGVHGVPGGENTVRLGEKTVRYYTLREAATLQTFPVDYVFEGARLHVTRQIGNAVPPLLASVVGTKLLKLLKTAESRKSSRR